MVNLMICELVKLKRAKMLFISLLGALAAPFMMLVEALQTHFEHPEQLFTLEDIYSNSLLYIMLLMNMMVYIVIAAHLFSREYTERTLKNILPIPVSKTAFTISKFCVLFLWIMALTIISWAAILLLSGGYHLIIGLEGYSGAVALRWLGKMLLGGSFMFFTISPFAYLAEKTKGIAAPIITAAAVVMGSAALTNQELGALFPWTATYFIIDGKLADTGYPVWLSLLIIAAVSVFGFWAAIWHFNREDIK